MNRNNRGLIEGVIWKELLLFAFPIMLGSFFQQLYNTADAVVVGRSAGKEALAAVGGSTGALSRVLVNFFVGLSSGATVVIAQSFGAGDKERTSRAVHTAMTLALFVGVAVSVFGVIVSPWALRAVGTPPEVLPHSTAYLRIFCGGLIFTVIYNMGTAVLRAKGDSRRPFLLLLIATAVNIVMDLVFVVTLRWGVAGAAWATVIAQAMSALGVWIILSRERDEFRLCLKGLFPLDRALLGNVMRIGTPAAIQNDMYAFSNVIVNSGFNSFGVDVAAAWTAFGKVDAVYWVVMSALGISMSAFAGQNFGARKYDRVRAGIRTCAVISLIWSVLFALVTVPPRGLIFRIFTSDPAVIALSSDMILLMAGTFWLYVPVEAYSGSIRGTGDVIIPTCITAFGVCAFRLFWTLAVLPLHRDLTLLTVGYPVSWALTSLAFFIYDRRGSWLERSILRAGHRRQ